MNDSSPTSVLLCGAGSRGRTVYAQFALDHPHLVKIVAVAEPLHERRKAVAESHGIPPQLQFESWREVGSQHPVAQVAIVATDDLDHLQPSLKFLAEGYHLLLEKPMAPTLGECEQIVAAAAKSRTLSAVSHVLRYTPYFKKLRQLIEQGAVGDVICIRHFEPVNYWHFAHSFVRGNWRNSEGGSPFILAKCCHDMDILLYLMRQKPTGVHSFGSLSHFRTESAPPRAAKRCLECEWNDDCVYSAGKFYQNMLRNGQHWWPLDVVISEFSEQALIEALTSGPYGRCVYHCDNNMPDHQVVNLEFSNGSTASFVATAFSDVPARETEILGTFGSLKGDGNTIVWNDFRRREKLKIVVEGEGNHLGGDTAMLHEFFRAVKQNDASLLSSTPKVSLVSHKMALLAERSRLEGKSIRIT